MKLNRLTVDGHKHELRNVVIIIGPNNAGKTQLMEDLYYELVNSYERDSENDYVVSSTENSIWPSMIEKNDFEYDADEMNSWVSSHEPWKRVEDSSSPRASHMMYRSKNNVLQWDMGNDGAMFEDELRNITNNPTFRSDQLVRYKKAHVSIARIDQRFSEASQIENIDVQNNDNPKLFYVRESTLKELNKHIGKLFNKKFIVIKYSPNQYKILLVGVDEKNVPKWAGSNNYDSDRRSIVLHREFADNNKNALISAQSHGTRAAASILLSLADKHRKIVIIDEPESHIYPAARKYIGSIIAKESDSRQFFVVTHDVELLERLANSRKNFSIVKVNRDRQIKVVDFNQSQRRRTSSELKNTKALRAGFSDAAIFVEGISDKYLYEAILRRKKLISEDIEYDVIDCDGNDKIADSVKFSFDIGTRVAVITDFDTLLRVKKNGGIIDRICDALSGPDAIRNDISQLREELKGIPSNTKGLNAEKLTNSQVLLIESVLNRLKEIGIFIVPYGELYNWFDAKKSDAPVEVLRNRYFNNSKKYHELTAFLKEVAEYSSK